MKKINQKKKDKYHVHPLSYLTSSGHLKSRRSVSIKPTALFGAYNSCRAQRLGISRPQGGLHKGKGIWSKELHVYWVTKSSSMSKKTNLHGYISKGRHQ